MAKVELIIENADRSVLNDLGMARSGEPLPGVPDGVEATVGWLELRKSADIPAETFQLVVTFVVAPLVTGLFSNWLYEKLRGREAGPRVKSIRTRRRTVEVITPDSIQRVIEEEIIEDEVA